MSKNLPFQVLQSCLVGKSVKVNPKNSKGKLEKKKTNEVYRAAVIVSRSIGQNWKELYRVLPLEPERSSEQRESDIEEILGKKLEFPPLTQNIRREITWVGTSMEANEDFDFSTIDEKKSFENKPKRISAYAKIDRTKTETIITNRERALSVSVSKTAFLMLKKWLLWNTNPTIEHLLSALNKIGRKDVVYGVHQYFDKWKGKEF